MIKRQDVGKLYSPNRPGIGILLVGLALLLTACGNQPDGTQVSEAFWATTAFDLDDQPVALLKYRGQPLVVNFWARWCPPCRDEIPDFVRARAHFKAQGVEVLGIAIEDQVGPVREFARDFAIDYPVLLAKDQGYALMLAMGNNQDALPFTVAIDRHGNVVARKLGRMSSTEVEAAFQAALR
jgi:thiol-disulfide isomerase/thioredoxin